MRCISPIRDGQQRGGSASALFLGGPLPFFDQVSVVDVVRARTTVG